MDYEASPKEFKAFSNAASRNKWCRDVIEAFNAERENYAGLVSLYESYQPKLFEMDNGNEYDRLAAENLRARYDAIVAGIRESREWVSQLVAEWQERELMK